MIETITQLAHSVPAWFAAHPSVGSIIYGWLFGVVVTQGCKRFYPLGWVATPEKVKRTSQLIATISAGAFAFSVWPDTEPYRLPFALLCGMACPQVYTALKAALPTILARWGWSAVVMKRVSEP